MTVSPRTIWAYSYRLAPPQPAKRLRKVRAILEQGHREAKARGDTWEGRLVVDDRVAHILVVSDTPGLGHGVHRRIEDALRALCADFSVTVPLLVDRDAANAPPPSALPRRN